MKNKAQIKKLSEMGILVAVAIVIDLLAGLISPFRYGGSISPAMLFIFVIAYRHGVKAGLVSGLAFGILSSLVGIPLGITYIIRPDQYFLDYMLAFFVLGVAGIFKNGTTKALPLILGMALGSFLRYLAHGFSGVLFFSIYAIELGENVWFYSFILYNLPYMAASFVFCAIIGLILQKRGILAYNLLKEE
jgi:thiamine transporter